MWTSTFWKAAAERALRTVAQVLLSLWVSDGVFNALSIDWLNALGVALGAALISVLMSMVPAGPEGSPSWVRDPAAGRHAR
jgi:hypothetical protein